MDYRWDEKFCEDNTAGNIAREGKMRNTYKILVGKHGQR
jgi:hypothetical protein